MYARRPGVLVVLLMLLTGTLLFAAPARRSYEWTGRITWESKGSFSCRHDYGVETHSQDSAATFDVRLAEIPSPHGQSRVSNNAGESLATVHLVPIEVRYSLDVDEHIRTFGGGKWKEYRELGHAGGTLEGDRLRRGTNMRLKGDVIPLAQEPPVPYRRIPPAPQDARSTLHFVSDPQVGSYHLNLSFTDAGWTKQENVALYQGINHTGTRGSPYATAEETFLANMGFSSWVLSGQIDPADETRVKGSHSYRQAVQIAHYHPDLDHIQVTVTWDLKRTPKALAPLPDPSTDGPTRSPSPSPGAGTGGLASADLEIKVQAPPGPMPRNRPSPFRIAVKNLGPDTAQDVQVTVAFTGSRYLSATLTRGSAQRQGETSVNLSMGAMRRNETVNATISTQPQGWAKLEQGMAVVFSQVTPDPRMDNNQAKWRVRF